MGRWRWLLANFVQREITSRYTGAIGGLGWAVVTPIVQLAVYGIVFGVLLRIPESHLGGLRFIGFLALALWPWLMFADGVQRAAACVSGNANLIRKVSFPHELLVFASVGASYIINGAGWLIVIFSLILWGEPIHATGLLLVIPLFVAQLAFTVGVGALLAASQVLLRDVEHALGLALTVAFYATPIVYPLGVIPQPYRDWISANPIAYIVTRYRDILTGASGWQNGDLWVLLGSLLALLAGLWAFRRLSPHFEDFL